MPRIYISKKIVSPNLVEWPRIGPGVLIAEMNLYGWLTAYQKHGKYQSAFHMKDIVTINLLDRLEHLTDSPEMVLHAIAIVRQNNKPFSFCHKVGKKKDRPRLARIAPGRNPGSIVLFQYTLKVDTS